jgi:hypothetical protein
LCWAINSREKTVKIDDVAALAKAGQTHLELAAVDLAELVQDLEDHPDYGVPAPAPFYLFGVRIAPKGLSQEAEPGASP